MNKFSKQIKRVVFIAALGLLSFSTQVQANAWDTYKSRFVTADGAVIDTGNNNISHSEGQGYGLMFALAYDDRETFNKILNWTNTHLKNHTNNLFYWSYRPMENDPVADKNNASDGDLFIAWTLIKAARKWNDSKYRSQAEQITLGLKKFAVTKFAGLYLLLPGTSGFHNNSSVIINPSYFIFPALQEVSQYTHLKLWQDVSNDCYVMIDRISSELATKVKLVPDWVEMNAQGKVSPAPGWAPRSSFDAIRVPVYLYWLSATNSHLTPWKEWFSSFEDGKNPAWVNVSTGETAEYAMTEGLEAVRKLVLGKLPNTEPEINNNDDYYNASLKLLVYLASKHF